MGHTRHLFLILFVLSILAPKLRAQSEYSKNVEALEKKVSDIRISGSVPRPNWEGIKKEITASLGFLHDNVDSKFEVEITEQLTAIYEARGGELGAVKKQIEETLAILSGSADPDLSILKPSPRGPTASLLDPKLSGYLTAVCRFSDCKPVENLFALLSNNIVALGQALRLGHYGEIADGKPSLEWIQFFVFQEYLEDSLQTLQMLFPTFPDVRRGRLRTNTAPNRGGHELNQESLTEFVDDSFGDRRGRVPHSAEIMRQIYALEEAVYYMDLYRLYYFPRINNDQQAEHLRTAIFSVPGAMDCMQLAKGTSGFQGGACEPKAFSAALQKYIDFYEKHAETGFYHLVVRELRNFIDKIDKTDNKTATDEMWAKFNADLKVIQLRDDYADDLKKTHKKTWNDLADEMTEAKSELRNLVAPDGDREPYLRNFFAKYNLDILTFEPGFREESRAIVDSAIETQRLFKKNVEDFFLENKTFPEQIGLPEKFMKVDGRYETCGHFGTKYMTDSTERNKKYYWTEEEFKKNSPFVLYASKEAVEPEVIAASSANGYQRLDWRFKVSFGNLYSLSTMESRGRELLAASILYTRHRMMIPTVTQTRLLLGDAKIKAPEEMGIHSLPMWAQSQMLNTYHFPKGARIVKEAETAFDEALFRYADRLGDGGPLGSVPTAFALLEQENGEKPTSEKVIEFRKNLFKGKYTEILKRYQRQHRKDLLQAAVHLKKWKGLSNGLRRKKPRSGATAMAVRSDDKFYEDLDEEKAELYEFASDLIAYKFPMLLQKDENDEYYYLNYKDADYENCLRRFLNNAVEQANAGYNKETFSEIINDAISNPMLTAMAVQPFPQLKQILCEYQYNTKWWSDTWDWTLTGASVITTAVSIGIACVCPVAAPLSLSIGAAVNVGIGGLSFVSQGMRARNRYAELAQLDDFMSTSASQLTPEEFSYGETEAMPELKAEADWERNLAIADGVFLVASTIGGARTLKSAMATMARSGSRAAKETFKSSIKYAGKVWRYPGRHTIRGLLTNRAGRGLLFGPLMRRKVVQSFGKIEVLSLFNRRSFKEYLRVGWRSVKLGADAYDNWPVLWAGLRWGHAKWVWGLRLTGWVVPPVWGAYEWIKTEHEAMIDAALQSVETRARLTDLEAMRGGYMTEAEVFDRMRLNDTKWKAFLKSIAVEEEKYKQNSDPTNPLRTVEMRREALDNLRLIRKTMETKIEELKLLGRAGKDNRYFTAVSIRDIATYDLSVWGGGYQEMEGDKK